MSPDFNAEIFGVGLVGKEAMDLAGSLDFGETQYSGETSRRESRFQC